MDTTMDTNLSAWYPLCNESLPKPPVSVNVTDNVSDHSGPQMSALKYVDLAVLPAICVLGIIGNILNLLVLTRRRLMSGMDRLEKSANFGLIALAFSDMMFCILAFPFTFIEINTRFVQAPKLFMMYYKIYGSALLNLFLMTGTWLITSMAINRYIVVVYPFRARQVLGARRTVLTIVAVYILSAIITLPFFLHPGIGQCAWTETEVRYLFIYLWDAQVVAGIKLYRQWMWPILAHFVPVLVLAFCNTRLIQELRSATVIRKRTCQGQQVKDSSRKVTLTLVSIVLMLLFFVSPGEVIRYLDPYKMWGYEVGHVVASVLNVMQTLNFALNFVLYCVVNANFRGTFKSIIFCCPQCREHRPGLAAIPYHTSNFDTKNGIAFKPVTTKTDV